MRDKDNEKKREGRRGEGREAGNGERESKGWNIVEGDKIESDGSLAWIRRDRNWSSCSSSKPCSFRPADSLQKAVFDVFVDPSCRHSGSSIAAACA